MANRSQPLRLKINWNTTKLMVNDWSKRIPMENLHNDIECVAELIYLWALITSKESCGAEISRQISVSRTPARTYNRKSDKLKYKSVFDWIIRVLYIAMRIWVMDIQVLRQKIDAFEICCWLRIAWSTRKANESKNSWKKSKNDCPSYAKWYSQILWSR